VRAIPPIVLDLVHREEGSDMKTARWGLAIVAISLAMSSLTAYAASGDYSAWSQAVRVESIPGTHPDFNGAALDGCPFVSRDGKTFFMASTRAGGLGGIDIWVSQRASAEDPWGAPVNVGAPVNSSANDFCPTLSRDGHLFYFVSNRAGGCGGDDIYTTRLRPDGWDPVANLGCEVNSAANEASPFPLPESSEGPVLYFSSTRAGTSDLYRGESHGNVFGPAAPVSELNSPTAQDGHPNVRRDGLEIFFFSTRPGTLGAQDIYSATRASTSDPWSAPVNLGALVNSSAADTRPSLSWDGTTLYFGSTRAGGEGDSDHYVTTREGT
jgi:Tol biopolymer transport system component